VVKQFDYKKFERLSGLELGLYCFSDGKQLGLPDDFLRYFQENCDSFDNLHLECALALLKDVKSTEAYREIVKYIDYPDTSVRFPAIKILTNFEKYDEIDEKIINDEQIMAKIEQTLEDHSELFAVDELKYVLRRKRWWKATAIKIEFPDEHTTMKIDVTQIDENLYRLDNVPFWVQSANFRDIIETESIGTDVLRFKRVVEKSNWHVYDFLLPEDRIESEEMQSVRKYVSQLGGYSERLCGGCLYICLPPEVKYDPTPTITGQQKSFLLKLLSFLPPVYQLSLDGNSITFRKFFTTKTFDLSDIQEVQVKTTDQGPFACDVFIVLLTNKGKCIIPQQIPGTLLLLQKLQELPGFSNETYIDAMSCGENRKFLCWKKQNG
jgi:hypothetical protein